MHALIEIYHNLTDPVWIENHYGLYLVLFIIFAETGLFVGFFLPGDSLLFVSGMMISGAHAPFENSFMNLLYWIVLLTIGGVLGNIVGYWFGNKSGHMLMKRPDSFLFKKKHLMQAHDFYEKKGGIAILLARFLPIVRTFAPIVAGIVQMDKKKFYCQSCDYGCDNNSTYNKHLKSQVHARGGQKKIYKCEYCDYSTKISVWNCKMHTLAKHASKEVKAQQKYYCVLCDVVFFCKAYQDKHNAGRNHNVKVKVQESLKNLPK